MSLSRNLSASGVNYNNSGYEYEWYQCNCCPYGYHIDLDFVRYCDSVGQTVERTASMKRRKDRRRQRQSMDMLLGLIPPLLDGVGQNHATIQEYTPCKVDASKSILIEDTMLNDAVDDFERTLQRSKNTLSNNLPDVTAVFDNHSPSVSSASGSSMTVLHAVDGDAAARDFDVVSVESSSLSPIALHAIREQMAISLERMRQLEEQVKVIPSLQGQILVLKQEKQKLQQQLEKEESENSRLNSVNANYITSNNLCPKSRSLSFTHIDILPRKERRDIAASRRDFGITCTVLTRNVGVGHQYPNTRTVSTTTLTEQIVSEPKKAVSAARGTQTVTYRDSKTIQTVDASHVQRPLRDGYSQTFQNKNSIGVTATPDTSNTNIQVTPETRTVAISEDKISDLLCLNCRINKKDVPSTRKDFGTNTDIFSDPLPSVSLASLSASRQVETAPTQVENSPPAPSRSIGCQHVYSGVDKFIQHKLKLSTKASQHEVKLAHKTIQYEVIPISKNTDTIDLGPVMVNSGCDPVVANVVEASTNTVEVELCSKCANKDKEKVKSEEGTPPSRIPRLQTPTTPVESRKFMRQETYTKVSTPVTASAIVTEKLIVSSGSQSDQIKSSNSNPLDAPRALTDFQDLKVAKLPMPIVDNDIQEPLTPLGDCSERKKATPSKEMQAAMKVLNDSLQKHQKRNLETQLKSALSIIQQEWFQISSTITAKPLDVEDYLDCFEDISSALLEYIVNMVDTSGNTAMHYAVSHGNFDVVSILLDSKVCNINKQNKAGYTCVMLVCLADMHSQTHATVVRRLFSLADVNIRAKQHAQTSLMLAVSHGRLDMVKMLLEAGADINIQDEDGSTALMCAAEHGHVEIVRHFLSQVDCDSSICDVDGSTALKIAMEAGHRHIGVLLYAHERNLHGPAKHKRSKSASASPRTPSSPLPIRSMARPSPSNK